MTDLENSLARQNESLAAAIVALLVLTGIMLLALMSRTPPHPPLEVAPFALAPFLGASLAIGAAALPLVRRGLPYGGTLAALFAATALVSFGPQKYFDPAFSRIWPAVIAAQIAAIVIFVSWIASYRRKKVSPEHG